MLRLANKRPQVAGLAKKTTEFQLAMQLSNSQILLALGKS